ncbi:transmembrane protein 254 isoform X2 [Macaca nemestrina]|uniref:transmembrane protein 254 isoform X2 n=1 Tax=Macaca nemestrina TaxID=9545 RepID=UPI0039B92CA4
MAPAAGAAAYFQRGSLFWFTVITLSFGYYTWVVFWPQSIPYQSLGPLGPFTQYLVDHHHTLLHNGYWLAWLIHVGESLYALVLCKVSLCLPDWSAVAGSRLTASSASQVHAILLPQPPE